MKKLILILTFVFLISCLLIGCGQQGESAIMSGAKSAGNSAAKTETKSAGIPSGLYLTTFSNIPNKPSSPDANTAEGSYYLCRVEIGEPSTQELLASVEFADDNVSCLTYTNPNDHSKYWIERNFNENGETTAVKVGSTAANSWYLNLYYFTKSDGMPALNATIPKPDSGVQSPDGEAISDPYADPERPIAGYKELRFKGSYEDGNKIREAVEQAGYKTSLPQYENGIYFFRTDPEMTGRAKIEDTVLEPEKWKAEGEGTKGNIGLYKRPGSFTGKITIDYMFSNLPFTIVINDARLDMLEDEDDRTSYTMSGTAEINPKSFTMGNLVFKLKDQQQKRFKEEHAFQVCKTPTPGVSWNYGESWEYVEDQYNTLFLLTVIYTTSKSPTDFSYIPVPDIDKLDGSHNMTFMMPASGGTAVWSFKEE